VKARHISVLTAALAVATVLTVPSATATATAAATTSAGHAGTARAAAYGFIGHEEGFGPTLDDAIHVAKQQMYGDYVGCKLPFMVVDDGQLANGTWWADVEANGCTGYR